MFEKHGRNVYLAEEINKTVDRDIELVRFYNEDMSDGKWKYMMSSKHVNFKHWNDEDSEYPKPVIRKLSSAEQRAKVIIERSESSTMASALFPRWTLTIPHQRKSMCLRHP